MLIAFVYDIFRIKRKAIKTNNLITYIEDLLYWGISAAIMFAIVYIGNEGEIRGYIFLGTLIGAVLYILLLSKLVMFISLKIIEFLKRVLKALWRIFVYPIRVIFRFFSIPCVFFYRVAARIFKKSRKAAKINLEKYKISNRIFKNRRKKI
jgi:spore cortex biosynthesis protein YabQ